jgi:transcription elongation factor GreB
MGRAFVKEDSLHQETTLKVQEIDAALEEQLFGTAKGTPKNFITPQGFARLQAQLHHLEQIERPALVEKASPQIQIDELDRKIYLLQRHIELAEIIDPEKQGGDRVLFGATVTVLDEDENRRVYRIVGVDETDSKTGKVSWVSPIGKALLQAQVGDIVDFVNPRGKEELEILKIEFKPIE